MKIFCILFIFVSNFYAQETTYKQVQIDMHGGKYDNSYKREYNSFSAANINQFLDVNTTREITK